MMNLNGLNPAQKEAVMHNDGPCCVVAGAGSGKTKVLTTRIARMIEDGIPANNILAVTFTRKAAAEMQERLYQLVGAAAEDVHMGTFHSICYRILREEWKEHRATPYEPAQESWQKRIIRSILAPPGKNNPWGMNWNLDVTQAIGWISWQKNNLITPEDEHLERTVTPEKHRRLYQLYEELKERERKLDFDDMLLWCYQMLKNPAVREKWAGRFRYILVDEYQDTNVAQNAILKLLAQPLNNVFVVGDARQCQPPGTMVLTPNGLRDIAELKDGDEVYSWDRNVQRVTKVPRKIKVGIRHYEGNLIRISVDGKTTRCTPNHKFLARWASKPKDLWVCYLMYRQDRGFRVGWCQLFDNRGNYHLGTRARLEKAEKTWILSYHTDKAEASAQESIISIRYGIPTVMFEPNAKFTPLYQDKVVEMVFAAADPQAGLKCLVDHGLDFDLPIYPYPGKRIWDHAGRPTIFQVYAANLSPWMSLPMPEEQVWEKIESVSRESYSGPVYSLDVEDTHNYVADGIVTLNSIYEWRCARPEFILNFEKEWPGARVIILDINYRSSTNIVQFSNQLIQKAAIEYPGICQANRGVTDDPILMHADDEDDEAQQIAEEIKTLVTGQQEGVPSNGTQYTPWGYGDIAILYRTNAQARALEDALIRAQIPYVVYGAVGFYNRKEVKDILAYLRIVVDPNDTEAIARVINVPSRFLGKAFFQKAQEYAYKQGIPLLQALGECPEAGQWRYRQVKDFLWCIDTLRKESQFRSPADMVMRVRNITGYDAWLLEEEGTEEGNDTDRLENLNALANAATRFGSLEEFLNYAEQVSSRNVEENGGDKVALMTIHKAKGLEFPVVFVAGMSNGLLPHRKAIQYDDGEIVPESIEEERRLCYVAMTRAKDRLYLSSIQQYLGKPLEQSIFLNDIWPERAFANRKERGEDSSCLDLKLNSA
jgi:DNA helicase-2/ATP-dependent DNA helicase PcrA